VNDRGKMNLARELSGGENVTVVGTSIILNNILNVPKKIEEHAENIQTKCMYPQYSHWAYAGNIL
jgi:hypothetical protein